MQGAQGQGLLWAIDSLALREGCIFSHGWCAHPNQAVATVAFRIEYANGETACVRADYPLSRPDVAAAHPGLPTQSGYSVHAQVPRHALATAIWLEVGLRNGQTVNKACALPPQSPTAADGNAGTHWPWRRLVHDLARVPLFLLRGDWGRMARAAKDRWAKLHSRPASDQEMLKLFQALRANTVLLVDHSLGGGANQFRAERIRHYTQAGRDVVLWTFIPYMLRYEVSLHVANASQPVKQYVVADAWRALLASGKVSQVEFNNCVGFPRQEDVGAMLGAFTQAGAHLRVYLHDFNLVCPSHFLLNDQGRFCGVPDVQRCRQCLPLIADPLVTLFAAKDIDLWRSRWGAVLAQAHEIVHFSHSTRALFSRAYPHLREAQWVFSPHQVPAATVQFHYPEQAGPVRVAVVGHIGPHKGSEQVRALWQQAQAQGVPLQLVVVGTLQGGDALVGVQQTGSYQRDQLGALLQAQQVHMALMPSICPETFSYVTHELMQMGVPIVCFDMGAQAEAVSSYAKGRVVPLGAAQELLQQIQDFKIELDSRA